jgi:A/G-specific adenine glycosylase
VFDSDARLVGALVDWFAKNRRDLPWRRVGRTGKRDPYAALVSELMLQQTQVSRVLEKYGAFMARFPDARALARAPEADVLAAWSGLGYYRRARFLHAAAKVIEKEHGGKVPGDEKALRSLPGVGRYTAGAIGSIALGLPMPIVDGNVSRVLFRVHGVEKAADDRDATAWVWARAEVLAREAHGAGCVGEFNEGLMELGATVCTPRNPSCDACPLAGLCAANRLGKQDRIPVAKAAAKRSALWCASVVVERGGKVLVEQRPDDGLWGGLWQVPTLERTDREPTTPEVAQWLGLAPEKLTLVGRFKHGTTHREVVFVVYTTSAMVRGRGVWKTRRAIGGLGVSNAQKRVMLGEW